MSNKHTPRCWASPFGFPYQAKGSPKIGQTRFPPRKKRRLFHTEEHPSWAKQEAEGPTHREVCGAAVGAAPDNAAAVPRGGGGATAAESSESGAKGGVWGVGVWSPMNLWCILLGCWDFNFLNF